MFLVTVLIYTVPALQELMNPSVERANSMVVSVMAGPSCSVKLEEERAAESVLSCLGHMSGWIPALCRSSPWAMLSFTKLLRFCSTGTAGADRLSLSCQDVICLGRPLSTPWDNPSTSYGLALPCDCQRSQHQAGQRGEAHGEHEITRCLLTISVLIVNTIFSTSRTLISWQIVSGAMLPQIRLFFLLIPLGV